MIRERKTGRERTEGSKEKKLFLKEEKMGENTKPVGKRQAGFVILWILALQIILSIGFSRQEY